MHGSRGGEVEVGKVGVGKVGVGKVGVGKVGVGKVGVGKVGVGKVGVGKVGVGKVHGSREGGSREGGSREGGSREGGSREGGSREGGKIGFGSREECVSVLSMPQSTSNVTVVVSPLVPQFPVDVTVSRSSEDPSTITVTWRPYNLVEARGFIEYIVQLHLEETQALEEEERVPMNKSSAEFSGLDTTSSYEVSVGTMSLSGDASGPGAAIIITPWWIWM